MYIVLIAPVFLAVTVQGAALSRQDVKAYGHPSNSKALSDPTQGEKDGHLFEGDMMLSPEQKQYIDDYTGKLSDGVVSQKRNLLTIVKTWPGNVVYYHPLEDTKYGTSPIWRDAIKSAMSLIEKNTCVRFKERSSGNRLVFKTGAGCSSFVGMREGGQPVTLATACLCTGTVTHELLHSLGFVHEQSRPDRDQHVTIHWDNIQEVYKHDFVKYSWYLVDTENVPYDVGSLLHYSSAAFAIDPSRPTITSRDPAKYNFMGQRFTMSDADIQLVNSVYKCPPA